MVEGLYQDDEPLAPFEFVTCPGAAAEGSKRELVNLRESRRALGDRRDRRQGVVIDTVHDGAHIPRRLLEIPQVAALAQSGALWRHYVEERDWGAGCVAGELARALGVGGFYQAALARVVMDFNRFTGSSREITTALDRLAISPPLSNCLDHEHKYQILDTYYDGISQAMEHAIAGKAIKLSIHTYDAHNASSTQRPEISLLTRSNSYQRQSRLPYGTFDPMFPDSLVSSCAHNVLRDRLALTLEKAGYSVEHNYPYCLPDGSIEVRSQPWFFFRYLRQCHEEAFPERRADEPYRLVWEMLLNTNLRSSRSEELRGYVHRFRQPPAAKAALFRAAREAYEAIASFLHSDDSLVRTYSRDHRMSALAIEVRKDLVWNFDGDHPVGPRVEEARQVAETIAAAVQTYLREDRSDHV